MYSGRLHCVLSAVFLLQVTGFELDGIVFHDRSLQTVAKCVADFSAGKSDAEPQKYIGLCMSADKPK